MSYKVLPYSDAVLKNCLIEQAGAHKKVIESKHHLICFNKYFAHINVQTIVVEENYVNRDFLEDYSSYYVRSFKNYKKICVRLHFFNNLFSEEDFSSILRGNPNGCTIEDLQEGYKGFMVLKPLPITIIGKTCLATYEDNGGRYFPTVRKYEANLFGIKLIVNSLAYQEQDSIVAACASSSIWTAFHGTGKLFQHSFPSPVEITKWATKYFPFANRHFPNKGLSGEQMAIAIREIGLEPYLYNVMTHDVLKATVYAYLKGKIPIVLGFNLWEVGEAGVEPRRFGKHAVTITGYNEINLLTNNFENVNNLTLSSSKIDKFFVHDDQVGPFAKMDFSSTTVKYKEYEFESLETTWIDSNREIGNIKAAPEVIILPLYHKIRIPFENVLASVNFFNQTFVPIASHMKKFQLFEWDIYLSDIRDFKNDILHNNKIPSEKKEEFLIEKYPKYLWRAIGKINNEEKIEFIFDATDIDQGSFLISTIIYDSVVESQYNVILDGYDSSYVANLTTKAMIESFQ